MILRILILTCAILATPSVGKMTLSKFFEKFENMCFQTKPEQPFQVNGQEIPLSNTIENFIALAEKFEAANPSYELREELTYFISEYVFENIRIVNKKINEWTIGRGRFDIVDKMWDPDVNGYRPNYNDPFTNDEKCSLYHMISHSILDKDIQVQRSYIPGNFSITDRVRKMELNSDDYFPQEIGAVAVRGTDAAVSLSKVLIGLFVGLKQDRKTDLTSYEDIVHIAPEKLPEDKIIDALYIVTMADVLMRAEWTQERPGFAPNGQWVSIQIDKEKKIDGFCPMVYLQKLDKKFLPAYSYSSVRGAADVNEELQFLIARVEHYLLVYEGYTMTDGLILGLAAQQVYMKKANTKLSQILRMYYSPDGISVDSIIEDFGTKHISFCNRDKFVEALDNELQDQMKKYGFLTTQKAEDVDEVYIAAKKNYDDEKRTIFQNSNTEIKEYCDRPNNIENPELLPRETNLDIIVVMDSKNSENSFQEQEMIVGYLAKYLDLRYTGSRMTILLDKKAREESGSSSKIALEPVVYDTYSSSFAACEAGQLPYEPSGNSVEEIIVGIDHFLQERKKNESKLYGVNGKVVIYFNYENDNGRNNNKIQGSLEKALRDLHLNHQDIDFYAVGLDSEMLKKYAKNDPSLVFLGTDGPPEEVAKKIYHKISFAPALLQYEECEDERNDKTVSYESLVSPHTIQHYEMPAKYFYKSLKVTFKFEAQNGNIRVCHNRATVRPENEIKNCKDTTGNTFAEFKISNPCKSFSKETCAPFYFSVMGMNQNEGEMKVDSRPRNYCTDLNDKWCSNLDQIKFKVSHTGIRCSGCLGLCAPPVIILLAVLLTYFVHKQF